MSDRIKIGAGSILAVAGFAFLYWQVLASLVSDWLTDDNYSHGFLILPLALYFAWERRDALTRLRPTPSGLGLAVMLGGLAMLLAGLLGAERFLPRASLLIVLTGSVAFLWGWGVVKVLSFPLAFLLLMIPIPAILFNQIAFPLQLLASRAGEMVLAALSVPVLREGNVIILAHTTLEVAEACSGIRSLISLLTLGIVYGYFIDPRPGIRWAVAAATIPIAIVSNGARVAGTGVAAHYFGPEAAEGFFHVFSGWLVFLLAFAMLFVGVQILLKLAPTPVVCAARPAEA